jgi:hypothetical protein
MAQTEERGRLTAYYFVVGRENEGEIDAFARVCGKRKCFIYRDEPSTLTVALREAGDALLFMNLFDGTIREEYKVVGDASVFAAA